MSKPPFLLSRVLLQFGDKSDDLLAQLSAVARTPDGCLWLGSDEYTTIERLSPIEPYVYGNHQSFSLGELVELPGPADEEVDIEGLDYADSYLWVIGSHSKKRKQPKGKNAAKDVRRLQTVETELNRFLIARIPVVGGKAFHSCVDAAHPDRTLTAASLARTDEGNDLTAALQQDEHLGPFLAMNLPSKENGFDIEGLAVKGDRLFLGLRGPVLRGWAIILEIQVQESSPGQLTLYSDKHSGPYKKYFFNLNGLGIRELCWRGDDLLILAGPTMDLEGAMQVFRWKHALEQSGDSFFSEDSGGLSLLFDLPFTIGSDHAEGLTLLPCLQDPEALMIVYDSPDERRRVSANSIYADLFRLD